MRQQPGDGLSLVDDIQAAQSVDFKRLTHRDIPTFGDERSRIDLGSIHVPERP